MKDPIRYLCIRCWRIVDRLDALARCGRCEAGGPQSGRRVRDLLGQGSLKRRVKDGEDELWCSDHPGSRLKLGCECGELLSPRAKFSGLDPIGLGFAGPFAAGKTLLLSSMVAALDGTRLPAGQVTLHGIADTDRRFASLRERLRRGERVGTLPEDLPRREDTGGPNRDGKASLWERNFCWEVLAGPEAGNPGGSLGLVAVYDLAGETWERLPELYEPELENFLRYLRLLRSLVFVLDGAVIACDLGLEVEDAWARTLRYRPGQQEARARFGDRGSEDSYVLGVIMERLGEGCGGVDLALTVSKMDLLWEHQAWRELGPGSVERLGEERRRQLVGEILSESHREGLVAAARQSFRSVEIFATSSLGFRPTEELVRNGRLLRPPQPVGLGEPLRWLLGKAREGVGEGRSSRSRGTDRTGPAPGPLGDVPLNEATGMRRRTDAATAATRGDMNQAIRVFLSHSHHDQELATGVIRLLSCALNLSSPVVRATSVAGYGLPGGVNTTERLRTEVLGADVLIALTSDSSVRSAYVAFELGARWGSGKTMIPLLAADFGVESLEGPLREKNCLSCSSVQLHQLVREVADHLGVSPQSADAYQAYVDEIIALGQRRERAGP